MHISLPVIPTQFSRFCLAVGTLSGIAVLGLGGQAAWADSTCTPPANGPTGPGAATFTYQCGGTYAGDWTNQYYEYNPTTGAQTALYTPDYKFDCATGTWTKGEWNYDAASGAYVESWVAATAPPDQPTNCATTSTGNTTTANAASGAASTSSTTPAATATTNPAVASDPSATNTNANATSSPAATTTPAQTTPTPSTCPSPTSGSDTLGPNNTADNNVGLDNSVCSGSQSGDATVENNGTAGDAASGTAVTEVDIANLVQTLNDVLGPGAVTFTTDINGNVTGDLVLDPSVILANAPNSDNQPGHAVSATSSGASINNDITASAASGDASVTGNGTAGNATSGTAEAIVNLINMINSAVAAGKSFIGTININGDLNGNILIPQSLIDELLATNGGGSNLPSDISNMNESITNNINASATSGNATEANNVNGGNATSGNAGTNVTLLNLTGSSIVGKNVLLVFVNVLGQWVGMIVNAPAGATSAEFGGGITSDTPSLSGSVVAADANLNITNNVNASATSGNATVADNYNGGDATSGNAETAVNILNVENSELSLANWFGILFINVFGIWNGNFGIQPTPAPASSSGSLNGSSAMASSVLHGRHHLALTHHFATFLSSATTDVTTLPAIIGTTGGDAMGVLGDTVSAPIAHHDFTSNNALPTSSSASHANFIMPAIGLFLALLLLAGAERDRLLRRKN